MPESSLTMLRTAGRVDVLGSPFDPRALLAAVPGRAALAMMVNHRVDGAVLDAAGPSLRVVANVAVGLDNIDLAAARARGIVVTNTPDVLTNAVAEFTWALILGVAHRIGEAERLVRAGRWTGFRFDLLLGTELSGKQLGIVGAGRIGRAVAAKAEAFGMSVVFSQHGAAQRIDGHAALPFEDLLASSDVVVLMVPLRPETRHLIDRAALSRMKQTAYLVNTARGPVVDEEALGAALRDGLIAGAALDVFEREPEVHPSLIGLDNVLLTPHLGSSTRETRTAMAELAARNILAVLSGRPALTPV